MGGTLITYSIVAAVNIKLPTSCSEPMTHSWRRLNSRYHAGDVTPGKLDRIENKHAAVVSWSRAGMSQGVGENKFYRGRVEGEGAVQVNLVSTGASRTR